MTGCCHTTSVMCFLSLININIIMYKNLGNINKTISDINFRFTFPRLWAEHLSNSCPGSVVVVVVALVVVVDK